MTFPAPPDKLVPFNNASVQPYDIGRQFDEHARVFRQVIDFLKSLVRDDGMLRNGTVGPEQLTPGLPDTLAAQALVSVEGMLSQVRASAAQAELSALEAGQLQARFEGLQRQIAASAGEMARMSEEVQKNLSGLTAGLDDVQAKLAAAEATPTSTPLEGKNFLGPNSGGFYAGDVEGATATSADYAQVSIEWAEHMPDTIPPNILAINAITGQHWSSRWWANRAGSYFGGATVWYYLGAYATPPQTAPTGEPLIPGMLYYDTSQGVMMVWSGAAWEPMSEVRVGTSQKLIYIATAGQTVFNLSTADYYGDTGQVKGDISVYRNGIMLAIDDGTGFGGFTCDSAANTVTLTYPAGVGEIIEIVIAEPVPASTMAVDAALYYKATSGQTVFSSLTPDLFGLTSPIGSSALQVYRNGSMVTPDNGSGVGGYTVDTTASTITLLYPAGAGELISIVIFGDASGGVSTAGVSSFNGRTGAVSFSPADLAGAGGAPLASPTFTGTPTTAASPPPGDNSTSLATTAFVGAAVTAAAGNYLPISGGTLTGQLNVSEATPILALNKTPGNNNLILGQVNGGNRWCMYFGDSSAEGTGSNGSNFVIQRFDNSGSGIDVPLSINRGSGSVNFSQIPTAPTPTAGDNSSNLATTAFVTASFAPLASPALTGTPTAPTAALNTNTTQLATTAFVLGQAAAALPNMDGTAAIGVSMRYARGDHVHPTDTSRAPLAGPVFTGQPTAPLYITSSAGPSYSFRPSGGTQPTDAKNWDFLVNSTAGDLNLRSLNDAYASAANVVTWTRNASYTNVTMTVNVPLTVLNSNFSVSSTASNNSNNLNYANSNSYNAYVFQKARGGSAASPAVVAQNDPLGAIQWYGYSGAAWTSAAAFTCIVTEATPSATAMGSKVTLSITPAGSAAVAPVVNFTSALTTLYSQLQFNTLPTNAANDSAAASAGVPVGGVYRNGSALMVRVA